MTTIIHMLQMDVLISTIFVVRTATAMYIWANHTGMAILMFFKSLYITLHVFQENGVFMDKTLVFSAELAMNSIVVNTNDTAITIFFIVVWAVDNFLAVNGVEILLLIIHTHGLLLLF